MSRKHGVLGRDARRSQTHLRDGKPGRLADTRVGHARWQPADGIETGDADTLVLPTQRR
jgi:hypothetical protein